MSEHETDDRPPILDPEVFADLQALEDSAVFLAELRQSLEETVPQVLVIVKEALAAGEVVEAASALAAICGSAEAVGASRLAGLAEGLAEQILAGARPEGAELGGAVEAELAAVLAALAGS